jgi:hypothetical protein
LWKTLETLSANDRGIRSERQNQGQELFFAAKMAAASREMKRKQCLSPILLPGPLLDAILFLNYHMTLVSG